MIASNHAHSTIKANASLNTKINGHDIFIKNAIKIKCSGIQVLFGPDYGGSNASGSPSGRSAELFSKR
ncbi:hypothetical protein AYI68_g7260 [Smittium mucronatum]|uniref:Uncharacterized protein n=1 Tax=Smittium mucronatum TaxID=133383 RepID=A0A1R0GP74_9FUNG|nr:hypothetical protein AYI68_g7260 [Smittium mucronatum]